MNKMERKENERKEKAKEREQKESNRKEKKRKKRERNERKKGKRRNYKKQEYILSRNGHQRRIIERKVEWKKKGDIKKERSYWQIKADAEN